MASKSEASTSATDTAPAPVHPLLDNDRVDYRPNPKVHLAEAGPVALTAWIGRIGDKRVRVYRGAQASKIPEAVQKRMRESGVQIGVITLAELGLKQFPGQRGARILGVNSEG